MTYVAHVLYLDWNISTHIISDFCPYNMTVDLI
jgi:hypothetical protein